ncbi:MAG: ABC transporter ATP-binding protein [Erysipelotrichaceae bacterium]|nr:ABC transporter ATP-binding protein [Erysipelotrichaceae bacterium]
MSIMGFIRKYLGKLWVKQILVFLIVIIYTFGNLFSPLMFSFIIDNLIEGKQITSPIFLFLTNNLGGVEYLRNNLWLAAIVLVLVNVVVGLCIFFRGKLNSEISQQMSQDIRNDLYNNIQLWPYSTLSRSKAGDLIQRCTSDVEVVRQFFSGQLAEVVYAVSITVFANVVLFSINGSLAVYSLVTLPVLFIVSLLFFKSIQKFFTRFDETEAELTTVMQENLANLRVVRAFNREKYEMDKFSIKNKELSKIDFELINHLGFQWGVGGSLSMAQVLLTTLIGIFFVINNQITIGQFSVFISYQSMIVYPVRSLARLLSNMGKMKVSIERLLEILNEKTEDIESGKVLDIKGDIKFSHVGFQYDDGTFPVLKDISFSVKPNETLAILGPTGSGKSTLVHLLTGLLDYTEGSITIDSVELKDIQKKCLRKNVGIVLQEPFLFSKTIYDNIKISRKDADKSKVYAAAKIASVHDVISEFSGGYDTLVGEKGVTLSGGQKQRIAIARTIINDCPILIFDDSLSAVDTQTDNEIRKAIKSLRKKCTTIIIAHRISSAQDADHIIVLENGRITQNGNHQQLVNQPGLYKRIYEIQTAMKEGDINE